MERFRTQRGREGKGEGNKKGGGDETRRGKGRAVGGGKARQTDGLGGTGKALTDSNGAPRQSGNIVRNQSVTVEPLSLSLRRGTRPFKVTICSVLPQIHCTTRPSKGHCPLSLSPTRLPDRSVSVSVHNQLWRPSTNRTETDGQNKLMGLSIDVLALAWLK